jgi:hypothetical protein
MSVRLYSFLTVVALLGSSPAFAIDNLYCPGSGSFYPTAISCAVPWTRITGPGPTSPQQAQQLAQLVQCKVAERDIRLVTAAQCPVEMARAKAEAEARAAAARPRQAANAPAPVAPAGAAPAPATPVPAANTIVCFISVETEKHVSESHTERMTYEQCEAEHAREQAAALAEEKDDNRKEAERAREFKNAAGAPFALYQEEVAQANRDADTRGFKQMSFEDFKLDGADLARSNGKASISGAYQKFGRIEYLFPNSGYVMQLMTDGNVSSGIILITDGAPRDIRKFFIECPDDLLPSSRGCPVTLLGHATTCELKTLVGSTNVPCLAVDDGWRVIQRY